MSKDERLALLMKKVKKAEKSKSITLEESIRRSEAWKSKYK